jgi:alpha-tubulin suppressor-like RCC1 family protein
MAATTYTVSQSYTNNQIFVWGADQKQYAVNNVYSATTTPTKLSSFNAYFNNKTIKYVGFTGGGIFCIDTNNHIHAGGYVNTNNSLGNGSNAPAFSDITNNGSFNGKTIVQIIGSTSYMVALDSSGNLHGSGNDNGIAFGQGGGYNVNLPFNISTSSSLNSIYGRTIVSFAPGTVGMAMVDTSGYVHTIGSGTYNGNSSTSVSSNGRMQNISVVGASAGTSVAGSSLIGAFVTNVYNYNNGMYAIDSSGNLHGWGDTNMGQLVNGNTSNSVYLPVNLTNIVGSAIYKKKIVGGCNNMKNNGFLCWDTSGNLYSYMTSMYDKLGFVNVTQLPNSSLSGKVVVSATTTAYSGVTTSLNGLGGASYALDSNGQVHGWSASSTLSNGLYGLGDGTTNYYNVPVNLSALTTNSTINNKFVYFLIAQNYNSTNVYALTNGVLTYSSPTVISKISPIQNQLYSFGSTNNGLYANNTTTNNSNTMNLCATRFGDLVSIKNSIVAAFPSYNSTSVYFLDTSGYLFSCSTGVNYASFNQPQLTTPVLSSFYGSMAGVRIQNIFIGINTAYALDITGKIHAWGTSAIELGCNITTTTYTPICLNTVANSPLNGVTIVNVFPINYSNPGAMAMDSSGNIYAWGNFVTPYYSRNSYMPVNITTAFYNYLNTSNKLIQVSSNNGWLTYLDNAGNVYDTAIMNNPTVFTNPVPFFANIPIVSLSVGYLSDHVGAIDTNGTLWMWGSNNYGQLGNNTTTTSSTVPINVNTVTSSILNGVKIVSAFTTNSTGNNSTIAIDSNGVAYYWGYSMLTSSSNLLPVNISSNYLNSAKVIYANMVNATGYMISTINPSNTPVFSSTIKFSSVGAGVQTGQQQISTGTYIVTSPTSNSLGAFTYSSSNTKVATVFNNIVTFISPGTVTITATQSAYGNYSSASVSVTMTVVAGLPTFGTFTMNEQYPSSAPFKITPPVSNSTGSFTYTSSNSSVATVAGSTITIVGTGSTTITATQAATSNYLAGTITATLKVNLPIYNLYDLLGYTLVVCSKQISNNTNQSVFEFNNYNGSTNTEFLYASPYTSGSTQVGINNNNNGSTSSPVTFASDMSNTYIYTMYFPLNSNTVLMTAYSSDTSGNLTSKMSPQSFLIGANTPICSFLTDCSNLWFGRSGTSSNYYYNGSYSQICLYNGNLNNDVSWNLLSRLVTSTGTNTYTSTTYTFGAATGFIPVTVNLNNTKYMSLSSQNVTINSINTVAANSNYGGYMSLTSFIPTTYTTAASVANLNQLYVWGTDQTQYSVNNIFTAPTIPTPITNYVPYLANKIINKISIITNSVFCFDSKNKIHSAGLNNSTRLASGGGNSTFADITNNGTFSGANIVKIFGANLCAMALDSSGTLHAWGQDNNSILAQGNGTSGVGITSSVPFNLSTSNAAYNSIYKRKIADFTMTDGCIAIVDTSGYVHTCGSSYNGNSPTAFNQWFNTQNISVVGASSGTNVAGSSLVGAFITNIYAIFAGFFALDSSGNLHGWGPGSTMSQLTLGNLNTNTNLPVNISNNSNSGIYGKKIVGASNNANTSNYSGEGFLCWDSSGNLYSYCTSVYDRLNFVNVGLLPYSSLYNKKIAYAVTSANGFNNTTLMNLGGASYALDTNGQLHGWMASPVAGNALYGLGDGTLNFYPVPVNMSAFTNTPLYGKNISSFNVGVASSTDVFVITSGPSTYVSPPVVYNTPYVNQIYSFGSNNSGVYGNNKTYSNTFINPAVTGLGDLSWNQSAIVAIYPSFGLTYYLDTSGYLYITNNGGEAKSFNTTAYTPILASFFGSLQGVTVSTVAIGSNTTYIIDTNGKLHVLGNNAYEMGISSTYTTYVPICVSNITSHPLYNKFITNVFPMNYNGSGAIAMDISGNIYAWGNFSVPYYSSSSYTPVNITTALYTYLNTKNTLVQIISNNNWTTYLDSAGNIYDTLMQSNPSQFSAPASGFYAPISTLSYTFNCQHIGAIDISGNLWMWGNNNGNGQLGNNTTNTSSSSPLLISNVSGSILTGVQLKSVSTGYSNTSTIATDVSGNAYFWGNNPLTTSNTLMPVSLTSNYYSLNNNSVLQAGLGQNYGHIVMPVSTGSSLTPSLGPFNIGNNTLSCGFNFILRPPRSNSLGAFTYTSSNPSVVAILPGNILNAVSVGTATITATQAAAGSYLSASTSVVITTVKGNPQYGTFTIANQSRSTSTFVITPPTSTSLVGFSYTSSNTAVATISGSTVTIVGNGSTNVTATQAASTDFSGGSITTTFSVNTLTTPVYGTFTITEQYVNTAPFTISAPSSTSPATITYTSSNTAVATVTGTTVTIVGTGSTTITASQVATTSYAAGSTSTTLKVSIPITSLYNMLGYTLVVATRQLANYSNQRVFEFNNNAASTPSEYVYVSPYVAGSTQIGLYSNGANTSSTFVSDLSRSYVYTAYFAKNSNTVLINAYSADTSGNLTSKFSQSFTYVTATPTTTFLTDCINMWFGRSGTSSNYYYNGSYSQICLYNGNLNTDASYSLLSNLLVAPSTNTFTTTAYTFGAATGFIPVTVQLYNTGNITSSSTSITLSNNTTSNGGYMSLYSMAATTYTSTSNFLTNKFYVWGTDQKQYTINTVLSNATTPSLMSSYVSYFNNKNIKYIGTTNGGIFCIDTNNHIHVGGTPSSFSNGAGGGYNFVDITNNGSFNGRTIVKIFGTATYFLALDSSGNLHGSGNDNGAYSMAQGGAYSTNYPINVSTSSSLNSIYGRTIVDFAAGAVGMAAVDTSGYVHTAGNGTYNGNNSTGPTQSLRTQNISVVGASTGTTVTGSSLIGAFVTNVYCTNSGLAALDSSGGFHVWGGSTGMGQLVYGYVSSVVKLPVNLCNVPTSGIYGKTIVGACNNTSPNISSNQGLMCWDSSGNVYSYSTSNYDKLNFVNIGMLPNSSFFNKVVSDATTTATSYYNIGISSLAGASYVLDTSGQVHGWLAGSTLNNGIYGLGDGTTNYYLTPTNLSMTTGNALYGKKVTQIASERYNSTNTYAITNGYYTLPIPVNTSSSLTPNKVYSFGSTNSGLYANNTTTSNSNSMNQCATGYGDLNWIKNPIVNVYINIGNNVAYFLDTSGYLYTCCTGSSNMSFNIPQSSVPVLSSFYGSLQGNPVKSIICGQNATYAIDITGQLHAWSNNQLELGYGSASAFSSGSYMPLCLTALSSSPLYGKTIVNVFPISYNGTGVIALDSSGSLYAWGSFVTTYFPTNSNIPVNITNALYSYLNNKYAIKQIVCGNGFITYLDVAGNVYDTLLQNNPGYFTTPASVFSNISIVSLATGYSCGHAGAIDSSGNLWMWGSNSNGQLANNTQNSSNTVPINVCTITNSMLLGLKFVSATLGVSSNSSVAIDVNGNAYYWGYCILNSSNNLLPFSINNNYLSNTNITSVALGNSTGYVVIAVPTTTTPTLGRFIVNGINAFTSLTQYTLVPPTSNSQGAFTFTSSNPSVATIVGNTLTSVGVGVTTITVTQAAYGFFTSASASVSVIVSIGSFGPFVLPTLTYAANSTYTITNPTSASPGAFTYTSSNTSVVTVSGNLLNIVNSGTSTITAMQSASSGYGVGYTISTITINKAPAVIVPNSFSTNNPGLSVNQPYNSTYTIVDPTSNSPGAFSYSINPPSAASINGKVITMLNAGSQQVTLTATQAATANYYSTSVSLTFIISPIDPIVSFSIPTLYYGSPYTMVSTSNSSGAITYSIDNSSIASINGSVLNMITVGSANVTLNQAATNNYNAFSVSVSLLVNQGTPNIGSFSFGYQTVGISYTITDPSSNSPGAFTYTSSNPAVASITGNVISMNSAGTVTVTASQAGTVNFVGRSVTASLQVNPVPTLGSFSIPVSYTIGIPYVFTDPSTNSTGAITYTIDNPSVASISGRTITMNSAGTTTIRLTQAITSTFGLATASSTFNVYPAPTLSNFVIPQYLYGSVGSFVVNNPTSNSTGAFTYTSNNGIVSINGNVFTINNYGLATITATQATDNANYGVASITTTLYITLQTNLGAFSVNTNNTLIYGNQYTITNPTSNSPGAFVYTSSDPTVATISGNTITILSTGTFVVTATQTAYTYFTTAATSTTVTVVQGTPSYGAFIIPVYTTQNKSFIINPPTSTSPVPFTYTIDNTSIATVSGSTVSIVGVAGTATITATQVANSNFVGNSITATLVVSATIPKTIYSLYDLIGYTLVICAKPVQNVTNQCVFDFYNTDGQEYLNSKYTTSSPTGLTMYVYNSPTKTYNFNTNLSRSCIYTLYFSDTSNNVLATVYSSDGSGNMTVDVSSQYLTYGGSTNSNSPTASFLSDCSNLLFGYNHSSTSTYYYGSYSQICLYNGNLNLDNSLNLLSTLITAPSANSSPTGSTYTFGAANGFTPLTVNLINTSKINVSTTKLDCSNGGYLSLGVFQAAVPTSTPRIYTWGADRNQYNVGTVLTSATTPTLLSNYVPYFVNKYIKSVQTVNYGIFCFDSNNRIHSGGSAYSGYNNQFANGLSSSKFADVTNNGSLRGATIVKIFGAGSVAMALDSAGRVHGWGYENGSVYLGQGQATVVNTYTPFIVTNTPTTNSIYNKTIVDFTLGTNGSAFVDNLGNLHMIGQYTGLDTNQTFSTYYTTQIINNVAGSSLNNIFVVKVFCGYQCYYALDSSGCLHFWGNTNQLTTYNYNQNVYLPVNLNSWIYSGLYGKNIVGGANNPNPRNSGYLGIVCWDSSGSLYSFNSGGFDLFNFVNVGLLPQSSLYNKAIVSASSTGNMNTGASYALDSSGQVHGWATSVATPGSGLYGLGDGTLNYYPIPVNLSLISNSPLFGNNVSSITTGYNNSTDVFAIVTGSSNYSSTAVNPGYQYGVQNTIYSFGVNNNGLYANGTTGNSNGLHQCATGYGDLSWNMNRVANIYAGAHVTFFLDVSGYLYMCTDGGGNRAFQLTNITTPRFCSAYGSLQGNKISMMALTTWTSFALDTNGKIHAWGDRNAELGYGNVYQTNGISGSGGISTPVCISDLSGSVLNGKVIVNIFAISTKAYYGGPTDGGAVAFDSSGRVYAWGDYYTYYLQTPSTMPLDVTSAFYTYFGNTNVPMKQISSFTFGTSNQPNSTWLMYLDICGNLYDSRNQKGYNDITPFTAPVAASVFGGNKIASIAYGHASEHAGAIDTQGNLWMWGKDDCGQLGYGSTSPAYNYTPTKTTLQKTFTKVKVGMVTNTTLALDSSGNAYLFGTDIVVNISTASKLSNGVSLSDTYSVRNIKDVILGCGGNSGGGDIQSYIML